MAMTMVKTAFLAAMLATLAGCGRPAFPAAVLAPVAKAPPGATALPAQALRKLLAAPGVAARFWGMTFEEAKYIPGSVSYAPYGPTNNGWTYYAVPGTEVAASWQLSMTYTGNGPLEHLGHGRFLYTVPEGQALVLNAVAGPGATINGFPVAPVVRPGYEDGHVYYVFGSRERVLIDVYQGSRLSGYTGEAAMFVGQRAGMAADGTQK